MASLAEWLREHLPVLAAAPATLPDGAVPQKATPEQTADQQADGAPSRGIDLLTRVPELSDDAVDELLQKVLADRGAEWTAERELVPQEVHEDG